jgi:hypothetical protein
MLLEINVPKYVTAVVSVILVMFSIWACGTPLTEAGSTLTPTSSPTLTIPVVLSTPTSLIPVSFAPDGVRMAYVMDGNLYFQDGNRPPLQLTHNQEYKHPIGFSENGEKIFFFQGRSSNLYSIHIDGSNEQPLATKELLNLNIAEYDESTTFCEPILVPHSNFVLFRNVGKITKISRI